MADTTRVWSGGAATAAQVLTETPSALSTVDIIYITLADHEGKTGTISHSVGSTAVATAVTALTAAAVAAKAGGADAWKDVTATDSTTTMVITADTAGNPFTRTASITGAGGSTSASAVLTANAGPNIFSTAQNWVGDTVYADGDLIVIPATASGTIYGEDVTAKQFRGFTVERGCPVNIAALNKPLTINMKDVSTYYNVELGGTGTAYLDIDNYHQIDCIDAAAGSPDDGTYGLNLTGAHDADSTGGRGTIYVNVGDGGSVGIAANAGEAMSVNSIVLRSGTVKIGADVGAYDSSAMPVVIEGGTHEIECAMTTYTKRGGTCAIRGSGAIVTLSEEGGLTSYLGSGTVTNCNVYGGGKVDANDNTSGATFTNVDVWAGGAYTNHNKRITETNGVDLNHCGLPGSPGARVSELDLGTDITVTRSTI